MKKRHSLFLLAFIPFLMSNSPAPSINPMLIDYDDFELVSVSRSFDEKNEVTNYFIDIKNTGDDFIFTNSTWISNVYDLRGGAYNLVIAPNDSYTFNLYCEGNVDYKIERSGLSFKAINPENINEVNIEKFEFYGKYGSIDYDENYDPIYSYFYSWRITIDKKIEENADESAIFAIKVGEKTFYEYSLQSNYVTLETDMDFKPDEADIIKAYVVDVEYSYYHNPAYDVIGVVIYVFLALCIVAIVGGIATGITFLIIGIVKHNKKKENKKKKKTTDQDY